MKLPLTLSFLLLIAGCASQGPYPVTERARDVGNCVTEQSAGHEPGVGPLRDCTDRKRRRARGGKNGMAATFFGDVFDSLMADWLGIEPVD